MSSAPEPILDDVMSEFMLDRLRDSDALGRYLKSYPQFACDLLDLAHELELQEVADDDEGPQDEAWAQASIDCFLASLAAPNPFAGLKKADYARIAASLDWKVGLIVQFRDRLVDVETVPARWLRRLAEELGGAGEGLVSWLRSPPQAPAGASFKSDRPPVVAAHKISFEQALEQAQYDLGQRARMLAEDP